MEEDGLVAAYLLDGRGGGKKADWDAIAAWTPANGILWVHLNRQMAHTRRWLRNDSGLTPLVADALLAESTRPRCVQMAGGTLLLLRGVNQNPGADPEDMVSIRIWIEETRIISVRLRRLLSIDDLRASLDDGRGPTGIGDFVAQLTGGLVSRMAGVIADLDEAVDGLQEQGLDGDDRSLRVDLTRLRREIIALRRYLAPQRDALHRLTLLQTPWLDDRQLWQVREETDRVTRYVEDLDAARERAAVTQEELSSRIAEQMNARMYVLSVIAAIFLPLGFLTGLFGINVGGMPLADDPWGFFDIVLLLVGITAVQLAIFRWRRWL